MKMKNLAIILGMLFCVVVGYAQLPDSDGKMDMKGVTEGIKRLSSKTWGLGAEKAPLKLNKYYKADDGSLIYLRQVGDMVYGLADRYDRRFSSILVGKIIGGNVKFNYFYIPKGEAKGKGFLNFKIEGVGRSQRLVLQRNSISNFNFKSMTTLTSLPAKIPVDDRAWYRGNTASNLTGRYTADNVGVSYILDLNGQIISYARGARKTGQSRPQFSTLFFGEKKGTIIKGAYIDLPLGHTVGVGETVFNLIGQHYLRVDKDYFYYGFEHKRALEDKKEIIK